MKQSTTKVATAILFDANGRVLLLKRSSKNKYFKEHWQLPEGKIEPNENAKEALLREVQEELGIKARIQEYLGSKIVRKTIGDHIYLVQRQIFLVDWAGEVDLSPEHTEMRWVDTSQNTQPLYPGTGPILRMFI